MEQRKRKRDAELESKDATIALLEVEIKELREANNAQKEELDKLKESIGNQADKRQRLKKGGAKKGGDHSEPEGMTVPV
jgi:FtsZ-binding cell division protein ZapB